MEIGLSKIDTKANWCQWKIITKENSEKKKFVQSVDKINIVTKEIDTIGNF